MGGLLGALFIYLNGLVNSYRRQFLRTKWQRVLEVVVLVAVTSTFIYYAPMILYDDCLPEEDK